MRETITAKEAAEVLGISEWTLYDWTRKKIIPHIKVCKRVLFRRQTLLDWLTNQEVASIEKMERENGKIRRLK